MKWRSLKSCVPAATKRSRKLMRPMRDVSVCFNYIALPVLYRKKKNKKEVIIYNYRTVVFLFMNFNITVEVERLCYSLQKTKLNFPLALPCPKSKKLHAFFLYCIEINAKLTGRPHLHLFIVGTLSCDNSNVCSFDVALHYPC